MVGLVTFVVRYRRQRNNLLNVIKREGGMYIGLSLGDCLFRQQTGLCLAEHTLSSPQDLRRVVPDAGYYGEQPYCSIYSV